MQYVVSSPRHRPGGIPIPPSDGDKAESNGLTSSGGSSSNHSHDPDDGLSTLAVTDSDKEKTYTVEDAVDSLSLGWFQVKIFVVGKMITAADAMEMMMLAVLSPLVRCEWALDDYQVAFITTAVFIGMGLSAPPLGIVGDKYGRKVVLVMVTLCIGYFGLLTTFAPTYGWILFLRGLVGVGMGGSPQGFSLNAEYIPSRYRAKLLIFGTIFWTLGSVFEIALAMLVVPPLGWRWLLALSAIPVLLAAAGLTFIPESARFLAAAGYLDDAQKVLEDAAKLNKSVLPEGRLVKSPEIPLGRPRDLLSREYLRSTLQVWVLWFGVAFTYYGMVLASSEVLRLRNAESLPINFFLIDWLGRRITGGLCYLGTAIFFILIQLDVSLGALTVLMFFVRAFSSACFNFAYIYSSELYPTSIRTLGMGIASAWARVGAMLTPFVAQVLLSSSVATATWVYGILCLCCSICCFLLPIETKGRAMPQSLSFDPNSDGIEMSEGSPMSDHPADSSEPRTDDVSLPARVATVSGREGLR